LLGALGFLVFVLAASIILLLFVMTGRPYFVIWFLIGPVLFSAILMQRTETLGTSWQRGTRDRDQTRVTEELQFMYGDRTYIPKVSSLFAGFDNLVSSIIATIVDRIDGARTTADLTFLTRVHFYDFINSQRPTEAGLSELLHVSLLGSCRELTSIGRQVADKNLSQQERCVFAQQYADQASRTFVSLSPQGIEYIAGLQFLFPQVMQTQVAIPLEQEIQVISQELQCPIQAGSYGQVSNVTQVASQIYQQGIGYANQIQSPQAMEDFIRGGPISGLSGPDYQRVFSQLS